MEDGTFSPNTHHDEECRDLFCDELRMRALDDADCPVWQLAHLETNHSTGQSFEVLGEPVSKLIVGSRHFVEVVVFSMAYGREGSGMVPEMWDKLLWECVWPYLVQLPRVGMIRGIVGRMASSSSFSDERTDGPQ